HSVWHQLRLRLSLCCALLRCMGRAQEAGMPHAQACSLAARQLAARQLAARQLRVHTCTIRRLSPQQRSIGRWVHP
ncbi:MAG: hypothetical protein ACK4ZJ_17405, partial [Allorhizobium sp.]